MSSDNSAPLSQSDVLSRVTIKESVRAKRLILRNRAGEIVLTIPKGTPRRRTDRFIKENETWISDRIRNAPKTAIERGSVPIEGSETPLIRLGKEDAPKTRGVPCAEPTGNGLKVWGDDFEASAQLRKFFTQRALVKFAQTVGRVQTRMNLHPTGLVLRNARTRWGSCNNTGRIMLNWRLIFAPPEILEYVVVHELAHLTHFDHSPRFWDLVDRSLIDGREARKKCEKWLAEHGTALNALL